MRHNIPDQGPGTRAGRAVTIGFRSLRVRNYRLFWIGQAISLVGTWAGEIGLAWLILNLSDSPVILGLSTTARFLPPALLCPFGGVLADRFPKRTLLLITQVSHLLIAAGLAVLTITGGIDIAWVFVLALLRGFIDAVDVPARKSFVIELVGKEDLPNAVALDSLQFNTARIVGPVIGAGLIAAVGISAALLMNAASFLFVIVSIVALRPRELHRASPPDRAPILGQLGEVLLFVRKTPDIALTLILVFAVSTFGYTFSTTLPLLARYVLNSGPTGLGALTASMGVGSTLAAAWTAYRGRPSRGMMLGAGVWFSLLLVLVGLSRLQGLTMVLLCAMGVSAVLFMTTANTRLQLLSPDHLRGRVMGIYVWLFLGTSPIGSAMVGWLAGWLGVRAMVLVMSGVCLLGVGVGLLYARMHRADLQSTITSAS